jgi:diguanylate cyclase (GGDEF)-like protein/PAS domain S-box-containing protein
MRTLLAANHALTHAQTEQELVDRICHVVVEDGGYTTAVVGFAEADEARSVRIVATSGPHASIMRSLKTSWADTPDGNGPCGIAIRENRIVVMRDLQHNPAFKRWRLMAQKTHHHACIAIPLHRRDRSVLGALLIYNNETSTAAREILPFDVEEAELLNQLGSNLGFGIGAIRARAAHNEARQLQIASEQRLDHLVAASPAILYALEYDGRNWRVVELTRNFERILGYAVEVGMTSAWWEGRIHPDDREGAQHAHLRVINGERTVSHYRVARASGGYCWLRDESVLIPETHGHPARILGTWLDTTEKQEAEAEIHRLAFFDSLTGLPNRRLFHDRLNVSLIESRRSGESCAVMLLDLDGFKEINDIYGHAAGDRVLTEVGDRLSRGLRGGDTVARLGGDEFVVMLPQLRGQQDTATERVLVLAQKLGLSIEKPILIDGHPVCVACSIGISLYPSHADNADNILKAADIAMYAAKATTKDRVWSSDQSSIAVFEPSMRVVVTDQHRIQAEIRAALAEDRFELWLQRQVDDSGNIIGAEALIRLRTEDGRLIPPLDFIPVAETTGLIIPIGHWLISEACRLLARIDSVRLPRLSINISAIEFRQPRFVEMMLERLQKAGVDATRLTVEITESLLIERLDQTIINLQKLRAYGLRISVDDFGTGYSGLAFLQRLPISEIKIDRRFINEMLTDQGSSGVTQTLITLARNLGFDIIAEGVETLEQAAFLQHHGCQSMQGFLFGRPEPASNYQAFMVENEHANAGMPAVSLTEPQRAGMFGDGVS